MFVKSANLKVYSVTYIEKVENFFHKKFSRMSLRLRKLMSLLVIRAARVHPVPSRTRKLSSPASMVLGGQPPGRVDHRQEAFLFNKLSAYTVLSFALI